MRRFKKILNASGQEMNSEEPMAIPIGMKKPETLAEQVQRLVGHSLLANQAQQQEDETDFSDVEEDDFYSPHELVFDPVLKREITTYEFMQNQTQYQADYLEADSEEITEILTKNQKKAAVAADPPPAKEPEK